MTRSRLADFALLGMLFTVTFEKLYWDVGGKWNITDLFALLFVIAYAADRIRRRDARWPETSLVVAGFFAVFLLVYLAGFYNLDTKQALDQFVKGMGKFVLHFAFLAAAIDYLWRRSERFYWRALAWFCGGIAANSVYALVQLAAQQTGHNLDTFIVKPLTGHTTGAELYGAVNGTSVYRANGLATDPNHLGIFLIVPLLVLAPIYVRLERGHRMRTPLGLLLGFFILAELATFSRSGLLGVFAGLLILAVPYRRLLFSRALFAPLAVVAVAGLAVVARNWHYFNTVFRSRLEHGDVSTSAHFGVYDFIPQILHSHPLLGLGFNNFSVYYEFVTGKQNWGPHSFYVALIVEGGIVGSAVFAVFLWWLFQRLRDGRRVGRALAAANDPAAARVRPLTWGLTAALVGTMAANVFYLTMTFFFFYAFVLLAVAVPVVFGRRLAIGARARTA
ncbi:MAG: O-antigen ligase family protein [Actinomycetota bacterium]|nr:O-antigen ligase family protein [Actinomycetota bacterium]